MKKKYTKLFVCLFLDAVGYMSYAVFGIGETIDVVWAPLAAWLNYRIFKEGAGAGGAILTFVEEALPYTDFIPSFTLTWLYANYVGKKNKSK